MKEEQRVYLKGSKERGDEVIRTLEKLGGSNISHYRGIDNEVYYYINPYGHIACASINVSAVTQFLQEFYKEITLPKWKPQCREQYFLITTTGKVIEDKWRDIIDDDLCYEFGNCFRTYDEAKVARDKIKEALKKLMK